MADREPGLQIIDVADPENPTFAGGYDTPGIIAGTVTDSESQPIESVYVELNTAVLASGRSDNIKPVNKAIIDKTSSSGGGILLDVVDSVCTDENGYYQFAIDAGTYGLSFSHPDYNDTTCAGLVVTRGDTTIMNMQLVLSGYEYVVGDINGSDSYNGLDITYGVAYLKGGDAPVPCADCPPSGIVTFSAPISRMK
ncbi:MAG: carboxypeptidase regulatory-like domain-containing protein [Candidatus Zixiibacteriota bacterium]|nr:MAG: carboxypeptidase regulatory-like domain-containing protein [candidate division Zixibacteria bacterium]